jgi:hypothetical protein
MSLDKQLIHMEKHPWSEASTSTRLHEKIRRGRIRTGRSTTCGGIIFRLVLLYMPAPFKIMPDSSCQHKVCLCDPRYFSHTLVEYQSSRREVRDHYRRPWPVPLVAWNPVSQQSARQIAQYLPSPPQHEEPSVAPAGTNDGRGSGGEEPPGSCLILSWSGIMSNKNSITTLVDHNMAG